MTKRLAKYPFPVRIIFSIVVVSLTISSCFFSARPIYYDKEQAVAERAVSQFHELHDQGKFEAIYNLMDKPASDVESRAQTLVDIKATFETVGKVKSSKLAEHNVFASPVPGFTSQVKLVYDTEFEKGSWTEFFVWNIKNSREPVLAEYHIVPKTNGPDSPK